MSENPDCQPVALRGPLLYNVDVTFDPASHSFKYDGHIDRETYAVKVYLGMAIIVFKLKSSPGQRLMFADDPLTWVDESGFPREMPSCFRLQRDAFDQITLIDFNTTPNEIAFGFRLHVVGVDNTVYTSHDPSIVNTETSGGGG